MPQRIELSSNGVILAEGQTGHSPRAVKANGASVVFYIPGRRRWLGILCELETENGLCHALRIQRLFARNDEAVLA